MSESSLSFANSDPPSLQDTTHLIPSRIHEHARRARYEPAILKIWVIALISITMIGLAVGVEVALHLSEKNNGFSFLTQDIFKKLPSRFLTAFVPTLLVAGLVLVWQGYDQMYKEFHPYVVLSKGNVAASESLLINYLRLRLYEIVLTALKHKHWLVLMSTTITLVGSLLQPIAGSIFQIIPVRIVNEGMSINSTRTVGLAPDVDQLNAFVAAAGYSEAAVFHGLPDPPFIFGGWAAAEFAFPTDAVLDGYLEVNTAGVQTAVNCENPKSSSLELSADSTNFTIRSTSNQECAGTATFNPDSANTQYGVASVPNCNSATAVEFMPVMFWYFHRRGDDNTPQAVSVFCAPTIKIFNINVNASLSNHSLIDVTSIDSYSTENNVTGNPINGQAYNGVKFTASNNSFVQARGVATNSGVPGAVFRFASQLGPAGLQATFDNPNGFLSITKQVYTQHLSITAKSIYFVGDSFHVSARMSSLVSRLCIESISAHLLSSLLIAIALFAMLLHVIHRRARRNLYLTSAPGSIAQIVSLTSHSGFGRKLFPYDDGEKLEEKLEGMRFSLDMRTGAILADEDDATLVNRHNSTSTISLLGPKAN